MDHVMVTHRSLLQRCIFFFHWLVNIVQINYNNLCQPISNLEHDIMSKFRNNIR